MVEFCRLLNSESVEIENSQVTPEKLAALLKLIDDGKISGKIAKTVFEEMFISGKDPEAIVEEKGLVQISDEGALGAMIDKIIAENPKSVEDYKSGNKKALGFFVGKIMKETQGQANPGMVNKMLTERLD